MPSFDVGHGRVDFVIAKDRKQSLSRSFGVAQEFDELELFDETCGWQRDSHPRTGVPPLEEAGHALRRAHDIALASGAFESTARFLESFHHSDGHERRCGFEFDHASRGRVVATEKHRIEPPIPLRVAGERPALDEGLTRGMSLVVRHRFSSWRRAAMS